MYNNHNPHGLSPGVKDVLPGWQWVEKHKHDLDGWQPTFELSGAGYKHSMVIKDTSIIKEIAKINR